MPRPQQRARHSDVREGLADALRAGVLEHAPLGSLGAADLEVDVLRVAAGALDQLLCVRWRTNTRTHTHTHTSEHVSTSLNRASEGVLTTPTLSLNTLQTFFIIPPWPGSSPIAISTCVNVLIWHAAASMLSIGSLYHCAPTR